MVDFLSERSLSHALDGTLHFKRPTTEAMDSFGGSVYFINGIWNDVAEFEDTAQEIADCLGIAVVGIYNAHETIGLVDLDLIESLFNKNDIFNSATASYRTMLDAVTRDCGRASMSESLLIVREASLREMCCERYFGMLTTIHNCSPI